MLNEKVDFQYLNIFVVFLGIVFLTVMWGSFYYFVRFKKKDDAYRGRFKDIHRPDSSSD